VNLLFTKAVPGAATRDDESGSFHGFSPKILFVRILILMIFCSLISELLWFSNIVSHFQFLINGSVKKLFWLSVKKLFNLKLVRFSLVRFYGFFDHPDNSS
jgi:hypothetical protein